MGIEQFKTKAEQLEARRASVAAVVEEMERLGPALTPMLAKLKPGMALVELCPKCGGKLSIQRPLERIYAKCETEGCLHFEQQPQSW